VSSRLVLTNAAARQSADDVQLYLHDTVAEVARPEVALLGFQRVTLAPGGRASVTFRVHADLTSFTGRVGARVVEPGAVELLVARSCADLHRTVARDPVRDLRRVGPPRPLTASALVEAGGRTTEEVTVG